MIDGLKVSNKWAPISGSPIVNVSRVQVAQPDLPVVLPDQPVQPVIMVNYDVEDGTDTDTAQQKTSSLKVEFDRADVEF